MPAAAAPPGGDGRPGGAGPAPTRRRRGSPPPRGRPAARRRRPTAGPGACRRSARRPRTRPAAARRAPVSAAGSRGSATRPRAPASGLPRSESRLWSRCIHRTGYGQAGTSPAVGEASAGGLAYEGRMAQVRNTRSPGAPERAAPHRPALVLIALILVAAVVTLNLAVANVALPDIGQAFDASQAALDLVAVAYSLGLAASVLYLGALGDHHGRKGMLVAGTLLAVPACLLAAYAPSVEVLIAARLLGGLAAGMAFPTTLALITALWAGAGRTRAIALWSAGGGAISALGPLTAGALLLDFWWGSVFLVTLPLAAVA